MSYVATIKDLLGRDLKKLITNITGYPEPSPEFQSIEEKSWFTILNHNCVSVTDEKVESDLSEFVDKFKYHNFPIKAQNLKLLICIYTNHSYFKDNFSPGLKWNLIDLLIKLSYRPTDALCDDCPLNTDKLFEIKSPLDDEIDWTSYLKEGWAKFALPSSDEDSWSTENPDSSDDEDLAVETWTSKYHPQIPLTQFNQDETLEKLRISEELRHFVESNSCAPWWNDPDYQHIERSPYLPLTWENAVINANSDSTVRILSEYKVIREIICILYNPCGQSSSLIIEKVSGGFIASNRVSIPSLSLPLFTAVIERFICDNLFYILRIFEFVNVHKNNQTSSSYRIYSLALQSLLRKFREKLVHIENKVKLQEHIFTIGMLISELRPWFRLIHFIYDVHLKAIYNDFKSIDNWKCALRLLSVLFNETTLCFDNCKKRATLEIFLKCFRGYLKIFDNMLTNERSHDRNNEMVLFRSKDPALGIIVRDYLPLISDIHGPCTNLWKIFVELGTSVLLSVDFQMQQGQSTNFSYPSSVCDSFLDGLFDDLLSEIHTSSKNKSISDDKIHSKCSNSSEGNNFDVKRVEFPSTSLFTGQAMNDQIYSMLEVEFDKLMDSKQVKLKRESSVDDFIKEIEQSDIVPVFIDDYVKKHLANSLKPWSMLEVPFAKIILEEYRLCDHLQYIWAVMFTRIDSIVPAIFNKVFNSASSEALCLSFRASLENFLPSPVIDKFTVIQLAVPAIMSVECHLEIIEDLLIKYKIKKQLKIIITEEMLLDYNKIFRLLMQLKYASKTLNKLRFRAFNGETRNAKGLFSLKILISHTVNAFVTYFSDFGEQSFLDEITKLCSNSKDLYTIQSAHHRFIAKCKVQCFFHDRKMMTLFKSLFEITKTLHKLWFLQTKRILATYYIEDLEKDYLDLMSSLTAHLHMNFLSSNQLKYNPSFRLLYDNLLPIMEEKWD